MAKKPYAQLFLSTLRISAFTFGGGYVIVPLMKKRFVDQLKWLSEQDMLDMIAIAQSAPGPIAVNASLMVGYRVCGIAGALITALGTVLPPLAIITVLSFFYARFRDNAYVGAVMNGMRAGVAAVICGVVWDMGKNVVKNGKAIQCVWMLAVFIAVYVMKINIIAVILACAAAGLLYGSLSRRIRQKGGERK